MSKSQLIASSNMRKSKGQVVTIIVLIFFASLLLNLCLMLSSDYKENFYRKHDKLNAEHVTLVIDENSKEFNDFLTNTLENDSRTTEYVLTDTMHMVGDFSYNGGVVNHEMVFIKKEDVLSKSVGKIEIIEEDTSFDGIYMPVMYRSNDIQLGNDININIGNNSVTYRIAGFFNSVMMGSHNCSICLYVLPSNLYGELQDSGYAQASTLCSIRISNPADSENYESMLNTVLDSEFPTSRSSSNTIAIVSQSRYISQMICSTIIAVMVMLVLLITIVVIVSNISNYIKENIKSLGALKAIGYTSKQLVCSLLFQFLSITLIASTIGIALSYCLFPAVNTMMTAQTGIPYEIRFLPIPIIITFIASCGSVALTVWLSSLKIKKIEPITALRSGLSTHNFKKNHIPLSKTRAPLNLSLALKTTLSNVKHNLTVCITMLVLSLVVVFSGVMIENMIIDSKPFLDMVIGETADCCINIQQEKQEEFILDIDNDERVEKLYLYTSLKVRHVGGVELLSNICDDFSKSNNQSIIYSGRFPQYDNEIAIAGMYAKEQNLKIGQEIEISADGKQAKYIITGFTQLSNNLGKDCLLTRAGYERIGELQNVSFYINLSKEVDIDTFLTDMKSEYGQMLNTTINIGSLIDSVGSVYISLMLIIVIAILILSAIIIALVLYLLVKTMLNSKKQDYGVYKALGFTTKQLVFQTALSFMPAIIISTVVGITIGSFVINPILSVFLGPIGIVKCNFTLPVGFIIGLGIGLIIISFIIACILSLRVKKIAPRALLTNE